MLGRNPRSKVFAQRIQRLDYVLAFGVGGIQLSDLETVVEDQGQLSKVSAVIEGSKQFLQARGVKSKMRIPAGLNDEGEGSNAAEEPFAIGDFAYNQQYSVSQCPKLASTAMK